MPYPGKTTPEAILNAAIAILEQQGSSALSMRQLANHLGIKAPSLYKHFADKRTLELAIIQHGATLLQQHLESALTHNLEASFYAVAHAYLDFARSHQELYSLMTHNLAPPVGASKAVWNLILDLISQITKTPDNTASTVALWSFLHGYSVLEKSGMFGQSGPQGGLEVGLKALLIGFTSKA
jgi:AcrR family transcriptional regulator